MNSEENIELEVKEPLSIKIEEPISTKRNRVYTCFQRIFNIDDAPNQKHYCPVFIIIMCILHVGMHLLTYINVRWNGEKFDRLLHRLCMFFLPCMRPTPDHIRVRIIICQPSMIENIPCHYEDVLKRVCFPFMYPYQFWRFISVNLLHLSFRHLLNNLFYQCLYGILLERKYGSVRVIIIYWLSDLGASLTFMLTDGEKGSVGASGALYGLRMFLLMDRLIAMRSSSGRRLFILLQVVLMVLFPFFITHLLLFILKFHVAHSAHFGGGVVGFFCSGCMLGFPCLWPTERCVSQTICRRISFVLLLIYFTTTLTIFALREAPMAAWITGIFS